MKPEVMQVITDARQILMNPEAWTDCFALALDAEGYDVWDIEHLEGMRLSLCGALDLASHRRGYDKAVMDAVVSFLYPITWKHILAPYPYPHELMESHAEGDHYLYEELGYFNDQDGRTHAEVMQVLNTALVHGYTKTLPKLPSHREAMTTAFTGLMQENKQKGIQ